MKTCAKCGYVGGCGCVFVHVAGELICKACDASARGVALDGDVRAEMDAWNGTNARNQNEMKKKIHPGQLANMKKQAGVVDKPHTLKTCTKCGYTAARAELFEDVAGMPFCLKCRYEARKEYLPLELFNELEAARVSTAQTKKVETAPMSPIEFSGETLPPSEPQLIPKILHFVWIGEKSLAQKNRDWLASWVRFNPDYRVILWASHPAIHEGAVEKLEVRALPPLINDWAFHNIEKWITGRATIAAQSDIVRLELVARMGGVYLDTDVECLAPIGDLLRGVRLFYADEFDAAPGNYCFGAVPNHPALWTTVRELTSHLLSKTAPTPGGKKAVPFNALAAAGPHYVAPKLRAHSDCVIFPSILFSPLWARGDAASVANYPPVSIANHHFQGTWYDQTKQSVNEVYTQGFTLNVE